MRLCVDISRDSLDTDDDELLFIYYRQLELEREKRALLSNVIFIATAKLPILLFSQVQVNGLCVSLSVSVSPSNFELIKFICSL